MEDMPQVALHLAIQQLQFSSQINFVRQLRIMSKEDVHSDADCRRKISGEVDMIMRRELTPSVSQKRTQKCNTFASMQGSSHEHFMTEKCPIG